MKIFKEMSAETETAMAGDGGEPIYLTDLENKLCEKKLAIIRSRRQEEQNLRAAAQRKLLRSKNIEEQQSRDPLNFRNQRKF